jgi:hypothetical protein
LSNTLKSATTADAANLAVAAATFATNLTEMDLLMALLREYRYGAGRGGPISGVLTGFAIPLVSAWLNARRGY